MSSWCSIRFRMPKIACVFFFRHLTSIYWQQPWQQPLPSSKPRVLVDLQCCLHHLLTQRSNLCRIILHLAGQACATITQISKKLGRSKSKMTRHDPMTSQWPSCPPKKRCQCSCSQLVMARFQSFLVCLSSRSEISIMDNSYQRSSNCEESGAFLTWGSPKSKIDRLSTVLVPPVPPF